MYKYLTKVIHLGTKEGDLFLAFAIKMDKSSDTMLILTFLECKHILGYSALSVNVYEQIIHWIASSWQKYNHLFSENMDRDIASARNLLGLIFYG